MNFETIEIGLKAFKLCSCWLFFGVVQKMPCFRSFWVRVNQKIICTSLCDINFYFGLSIRLHFSLIIDEESCLSPQSY